MPEQTNSNTSDRRSISITARLKCLQLSLSGINAATIAFSSRTDKARELAKTVLKICSNSLMTIEARYRRKALVGDAEEPGALITQLSRRKDNLRAFSSTRKQSRVLSAALQ